MAKNLWGALEAIEDRNKRGELPPTNECCEIEDHCGADETPEETGESEDVGPIGFGEEPPEDGDDDE